MRVSFKKYSLVVAAIAALAACSHTEKKGTEKMGLLTPQQEKVLAEGVDPNVIRDAVDAGVVAQSDVK